MFYVQFSAHVAIAKPTTCIFIKAKNYMGLSTLHETREGRSQTAV